MKNITLSKEEASIVALCISYFVFMFRDGPVNAISEAEFARLLDIKFELEK